MSPVKKTTRSIKKIAKPKRITLYAEVKGILETARNTAVRAVNFSMVIAYWEIGKRIVKDELRGKNRANYGKNTLKSLATRLTREFGKGLDERELRRFRQLYLTFQIRDALRPELSWTHYRLLIREENAHAREYYLRETVDQNWSTRELERQITCLYYQRLLSSKKRKTLTQKTKQKAREDKPTILDFVKDPYVLEFLNIDKNATLFEKDLEEELINKLQLFLLELGKGFSFVERQKRISADGENFYIDLVFYNYILKCFVLIDLKAGKLTHQDIGQMDLYVRYYEDQMRQDTDNPTIGIILCTEKNETVVKYSVLKESKQLFATKYRLHLPTEEELIKEVNFELAQLRQKKLK